MNIVYVCPTPTFYGDNIALLNIIPKLIDVGVNPYFILKSKCPMSERLDELGLKYGIYKISQSNIWYEYRGVRVLLGMVRQELLVSHKEYRRLLSEIKAFKPDIIHTNCSLTLLGYNIAQDLHVPHIWHLREYGELDHGYKRFPSKAAFLRKINNAGNYSISITDDIYRYYGNPVNGIVIYDGVVNRNTQESLASYNKNGYFLFVGRLIKTKGIEDVIDNFITYRASHDRNAQLLIAGEGESGYVNRLKDKCKKANCEANVIFLGYRSDVKELMSKAKALIVASRFEAFGLISVEAMLSGCPVIGHNVAGTKCQFDNGLKKTGHEIGLRYDKPGDILDRMIEIDTISEACVDEMRKYAQDTIYSFYDINEVASKVSDFYKKILLSKGI